MTLPHKITEVLFKTTDAHALCGVSLGESFDALSLPAWWNESHTDGRVRFGWLNDVNEAGIRAMVCSVTNTLGRVSCVEFSLALDTQDSEKATFAALKEIFSRRTGAKGKKELEGISWSTTTGTLRSDVHVRVASFTTEGERIHRIEGSLNLARGVEITADKRALFIDVEKLAQLLQTKEWPAEKCRAVFASYFSKEIEWQASPEDREAFKKIVRAVKETRADEIPALVERLCALMDWSDVDKGRDNRRVTYALSWIASYSLNLSTNRAPTPHGLWLKLNPLDVVCLVHSLAPSRGARHVGREDHPRDRVGRGRG